MPKSSWFVGRTNVHRTSSQRRRERTKRQSLKRKTTNESDTGASSQFIDPDEEREPPQSATGITFPQIDPPQRRIWDTATPPPDFQALFTRVLKPTDIGPTHFEALNIDLKPQCSVEEMVPMAKDGSSYLPAPVNALSETWQKDGPAALSEESRRSKAFLDRLSELAVDNETAYRIITRSVKSGASKPPRLAYMRNFWQGMESMSQYWDCTLDQHYTINNHEDSGEQSPKRQKLDSEAPVSDNTTAGAHHALPVRTMNGEEDDVSEKHTSNEKPGPPTSEDLAPAAKVPSGSAVAAPSKKKPWHLRPKSRYKGFRTNSGKQMPDQYRTDTIRGFVEGTVWPFQCSIHPPRMMPLVHFNKLKLPVRQSHAVYRLPTDRARARAGGIVGPVLGVQVRPDVEFEGNEAKARLDIMREIGGLLQLAQERAREGKTETKPGEGKWWTSVPRWGGGLGGEVENQDGNSDIVAMAAELLSETKTELGKAGKEASAKRKKKTPARLWQELKCGSGYFDPKTDYTAVGKDPVSEIDEVFLVSSLNHHVSILKLSVHRAYIDYLTSATMPEKLPNDPDWCKPVLQRTQWFDLFETQDRVEAFRALWGVAAYLTREIGDGADNGKREEGETKG